MQYGGLAEIYDALIYDMPYEKWAEFIEKSVDGSEILELGCGTGNLTALLAKKYHVTALDISPEMLLVADGKLRKTGKRARFVQGDMSSFLLNKQADNVICACDGINYLASPEKVKQTFSCVRKNLKSGGKFIFDISGYGKLSKMDGQLYSEDTDCVTYIWRNEFDRETKLIHMDITFFVSENGCDYERFDEEHIQRAHSVEEITLWLKECGFEHITVCADYSEKSVENTDGRITFTAI